MERRFDPTTAEWRMFAAHRQDRTFLPPEDHCPLCPTRPGGFPTEAPVPSFDVFVFNNRFPSLVKDPPPPSVEGTELYPVAPSSGANEVIIYSDDHTRQLSEMPVEHIVKIVDAWTDRYRQLGERPEVKYVFIFENRGVAVGVTLHHPHGQIYAYPEIPPRPRVEIAAATDRFERRGTCVFCDVVTAEVGAPDRLVTANDSFVAFVPFAARFPYEVHVTARRHAPSLLDLSAGERRDLAALLKRVVAGYDRLFGFPLPYVMSMHQKPTDDGADHEAVSHLHLEYTPLNRTETKLKYLAGSELGAGAFINDTEPEMTAARLRDAVGQAQG